MSENKKGKTPPKTREELLAISVPEDEDYACFDFGGDKIFILRPFGAEQFILVQQMAAKYMDVQAAEAIVRELKLPQCPDPDVLTFKEKRGLIDAITLWTAPVLPSIDIKKNTWLQKSPILPMQKAGSSSRPKSGNQETSTAEFSKDSH